MIVKRDSMLTGVAISAKPKWLRKIARLRVKVEGELILDIKCDAVKQGFFPITPPVRCDAGTEINGEFELTQKVKMARGSYLDFGLHLNPILTGGEAIIPRAIRRKELMKRFVIGFVIGAILFFVLTRILLALVG